LNRPVVGGHVQSIQARLTNEAHSSKRPFAEVLELFAIERFLHRLGRSEHRDRFALKGALLLRHWLGTDTRPTRDIDLSVAMALDAEQLRAVLGDILRASVVDDGIEFLLDSIAVTPIRHDSPVLGLRATFDGRLGRTRLRYQVDVGFGDAVFPPTEDVVPGGLLGFPMASIRAYTPYTTVAEKLQAVVELGEANSRLKDYYDLVFLPRSVAFDGPTLVESIRRTFARRSMPIPDGTPEGLGDAFIREPVTITRWKAFLRKSGLDGRANLDLPTLAGEIRRFALPPLEAAHDARPFEVQWPPGEAVAMTRRRYKPYPDYKNSGVEWLGEIPAGWEVKRLKTLIAEPITDGPHETPEFTIDGIPFLSVDGIQEGELVFEGCRYISEVAHKEYLRKCAPRRDDILLGKAASTGKIARVKVDYEFSVWSPLALIRPDNSEVWPGFLEYALKCAGTQAQIDVLCTSNTQKNISMRDIPVVVVCVAGLKEQRAIAAFLDRETARIDALVAKKERLIELLQEKRTALITRAVTKGLDPNVPMKDSGVEWLGEIPAHWEIKRIRHVVSRIEQGWSPECENREADDDEWGVLRGRAEISSHFR